MGFLPEKKFFIFGKPTQHSPSPAIHNAGFETNGTAFSYGVGETDDPLEALRILKQPTSGGGSVTIPLKEALMPHVDQVSTLAILQRPLAILQPYMAPPRSSIS